MRIIAASSLGIIVASSGLVNAAPNAFTEKTPARHKQLQELRSAIDTEGKVAPLAHCSANHGLKPKMPIKYLLVKLKNERRACDLIYDQHDGELRKPNSILLLTQKDTDTAAVFFEYRFDLQGRLLSAASSTGRKHEDGKPIKGSLSEKALDPRSKEVIAAANTALDYWLSGAYKEHMPVKKGGAAPESAKKPTATAAK